MEHRIERVRHEVRRRRLTVRAVGNVTPGMRRIVLEGPELEGFVSAAPDDHIKIFVPGEGGELEMRDYTPRRYDAAAGTLALDFAVHEAGPATRWALGAKPGDALQIGGPRGSMIVPVSFDWWLLVGDETALPAIGRRVEELPAGTRVITLAAVAGPEEEQGFDTAAEHSAYWVHRPLDRADDPAPLLDALRGIELPAGDGFVFVGAEAKVARAVRTELLARGQRADWMRAAGYWVKGSADAHEKIED